MKYRIVILLCTICYSAFSQGQKAAIERTRSKFNSFGMGPEISYNWQGKSPGAGLKMYFPIKSYIGLNFQSAYFPDISNESGEELESKAEEVYAGLNLQLNFLAGRKWEIYAAGGPHFHQWINRSEFNHETYQGNLVTKKEYKESNVVFNTSVGIIRGQGCFRPFLEHSYNPNYQEGITRIGFLFSFKYCQGPGGIPCPGRGNID